MIIINNVYAIINYKNLRNLTYQILGIETQFLRLDTENT